MASPWILGFYVLLWRVLNTHCQNINPPPQIPRSFRALGELSVQVEIYSDEPEAPVQVTFEENYDPENQRAAFSVWELGMNETFIENFRTEKTFQYVGNELCKEMKKEEWIEIEAPPSLMGFSSDGKIRFSVQKLMTVDSKYLKQSVTNATYRGLPANMWMYEIRGTVEDFVSIVTLYAYWSNSTWDTTGGRNIEVPLGYKITKIVHKPTPEIHSQTVNVFAFNYDVVNKGVFEAREGRFCETNYTGEFKFPVLPKLAAVSIHSEIAVAEYLEVKNLDIVFDMKNKLLRIDMDRIRNQEPGYLSPGRRISTEFTSKELGATFEIDIYKGKMTCEVTKIDDYEFEAQDIINPKLDAKYWDVYHFFGVNTTDYRYIGKATKRNIPCHVFQGRRTDWPEESTSTVSLWEWCLAVNYTNNEFQDDVVEFRDNELPLVSLTIYFEKSKDEDFPAGTKLIHHFYDVIAEDPDVMYATSFDVSRCFNSTLKKKLQFTIDVNLTEENIHIMENATSNPVFLQLWRDQMYSATGLTIGSLRIARIRSAIYNNIMYVTFTLLGVHPQLPNKSNQKSLANVEKDLKDAIDKGNVQIKYFYWRQKFFELKAQNGSLAPQIDPTKMVHNITKPTVSPPTGRTTPLSEITSTGSEITSTGSGIDTSKEKTIRGHAPGTVVGVSIAMLLVGLTLGAGGTFYKHRGLPLFCRRA